MMKKLIALAILLIGLPAASHAETLTVTLHNGSNEFLLVRFYSKSRNVAWPAGNQAFNLPADGEDHVFPLNCFAGEYICYGAWIGRMSHIRWGLGQGRGGCTNCCYHCDGSSPVVPQFVTNFGCQPGGPCE